MIFGNLGILGNGTPPQDFDDFIGNAYERSVCDLYADIALYFLKTKGGFGFLSHKEDTALEKRRPGLASWAPDWTSLDVPANIGFIEQNYTSNIEISIAIRLPALSPVLACIGHVVGVVDSVLPSLPPTCDIRAWQEEAAELEKKWGSSNVRASLVKKGYRRLYKQLCDWFAEHSVDGLSPLPDTSDFDMAMFLADRNSISSEVADSGLSDFARRYLEQLSGSSHSQPVKKQYRNSLREYHRPLALIPWLVIGMTDVTGPGCFPGRKIAVMKDFSFALVPESAQAGDIICRLINSPLPYLLRRKAVDSNCTPKYDLPTGKGPLAALDAKIERFFVEKKKQINGANHLYKEWGDDLESWEGLLVDHKEVKMLFPRLDTSRIEHFNFIGECFLDRRSWVKKWKYAAYHEQFILALH
jgi:hypothetical protein